MSSVITTDFERWKAQEAALGKPVALNEFVFANVPGLDPSKDISRDEKLPPAGQIVHRQAVNKAGLASENAVAYSVTLGTDVGDFVFNWIGLINKESGTLAMITHAPEQRKIKTVDGVQGNVLTRSFLLEFNGAAKETQITTSAETWQIDFTARLAGMDEIRRLANRDIYGAAAFFGDGFLVTKAAEQYRVTPGTAYIEGLRGTLEEITAFNNLRDTKIYADFTFQGNLVSKWQTFVKVTTAKTLAHYQDAAGFQHYVAVIAEIDQNGNITDKRVKGTAIDRELAELKKELPNKYQPIGDYQPAGSYVTTVDFSLELNKKIDKTSIAQQLGDETGKVPSLNLLKTELGGKTSKGDVAGILNQFGIGSVLKKMTSETESGFYLSASGSDDNPEKELGFVIINLAASGHYKSQIALTYATETPRAYFRNIFGDVKKPWEPIATKSAIDALNETLKEKLPKSSPAADTRISVTAQDYPVVSLHQTSTGDMFEIVATPTRNSLLFKHTAKNGTIKQVGIPFAEIESGADIAGQRIRKLYSGSGASVGQSFSFGTNGVGKTLIMFHKGMAKIQAPVTTQSYTAYAATGAGASIAMGVYPDRVTFVHNTGDGDIGEIWLVG